LITGNHAIIRGADPDDASFLHAFYAEGRLRAALLDAHREPLQPTQSELEELLGRKDGFQGSFHTVEDLTGAVRGFVSIRGANHEAGFADLVFLLDEDGVYTSGVGEEALAFILDRAFARMGLRKLLGHAVVGEDGLVAALAAGGFTHDGVQREILFARGRWHDIATMTRFARPGEGVRAQP